jgi:hypothetical protein
MERELILSSMALTSLISHAETLAARYHMGMKSALIMIDFFTP